MKSPMPFVTFTSSILMCFTISACKEVPVDSAGALPPEAGQSLVALNGTYAGKLMLGNFNQTRLIEPNFQIRVSNSGLRPILTANIDIAGRTCGSSIGRLLNFEVDGAWDVIANFEFDPGVCGNLVQGRRVTIYLNRGGNALLSLYRSTAPPVTQTSTRTAIEFRASLQKLNAAAAQ